MADIDIAIIGGGVSGVYSAWRLKEAYPHKKIVVFEEAIASVGVYCQCDHQASKIWLQSLAGCVFFQEYNP